MSRKKVEQTETSGRTEVEVLSVTNNEAKRSRECDDG